MPVPVTVITGASRGIGRAIARALSADGHRLVLAARSLEDLGEVAGEVLATGAHVVTVALDLRQPGAAQELVVAARERFGPPTCLINNAGTAPSHRVEDTTDEVLTAVFDLHVRLPLALARLCVSHMKEEGAGCMLQVASTAGLRGYPFTSAYTAAKHAMVGLTRAMHQELRPAGIAVYAVCPGFVDTDITRQAAKAAAGRGKTTADQAMAAMAAQNRIGRMHTPDEVADAVRRLVRDRPDGCVYDLDQEEPGFLEY